MNPYETRVIATVLILTILVCILLSMLAGCGGGDPKPPEETCGTRPIMCQ